MAGAFAAAFFAGAFLAAFLAGAFLAGAFAAAFLAGAFFALFLLALTFFAAFLAGAFFAAFFTAAFFAAGFAGFGAAFFEKNKVWKEKGATPLELGAKLAVYLASTESNGITGKLLSAQWDDWAKLHEHLDELAKSDIYCLRRITPKERGKTWGDK